MKNKEIDITEVWKYVHIGQSYNETVGYYKMVDENYAYVQGDQWRGLKADDLPKPVFNVIKRVRDYKVSSIMSQRITANYSVENISSNTNDENELIVLELVEMMNNFAGIKWEKDKMDAKVRECLMDGFTVGDYGMFTYWKADKETGQYAKGDFCSEVFDGVNILLGNPNCSEIEKQPYILLLGRDMVDNLKKEAKQNGVGKHMIDAISADENTEYTAGDAGKVELDKKNKASYCIKLWKEDGKVYYTKSTKFCIIKEKVDMRIKRYPLAFGNWEKTKNSAHGRGEATGMLPNQRYINKQFAMIMLWMMFNAMGKVAYDKNKIAGWSNQIGSAIPVNGDIGGAIQQLNAGNFNSGVLDVVNTTMSETLNALGVNDVVLGDIKPENTSAIIAVQKQSAVPLENVQANFYQFIEDIYLIWAEFMIAMYDTDRILPQDVDGEIEYATFNSIPLQDKLINVKINVGPSSHWSEITSQQTLDNLLQAGHITFKQYLQRVKEGTIPDTDKLIEEIEVIEQQQMMNQQYEQVAQEIENLPPEIQQQFMQLPPEEQEMAVQEYLNQ